MYSEKTADGPVRVENLEHLWPIIEKAHTDFPDFIGRHHHMILPERRIGEVKLVLVSPQTFQAFKLKYKKKPGDLDPVAHQSGRSMYCQRTDHSFDILVHKKTIRHELFHVLAEKVYLIAHYLPEENDAGLFEDENQ